MPGRVYYAHMMQIFRSRRPAQAVYDSRFVVSCWYTSQRIGTAWHPNQERKADGHRLVNALEGIYRASLLLYLLTFRRHHAPTHTVVFLEDDRGYIQSYFWPFSRAQDERNVEYEGSHQVILSSPNNVPFQGWPR